MRFIYIILFLSFIIVATSMQSKSSEENWFSYLAQYENGIPGSVRLRMDLIDSCPVKGYNTLLIVNIPYDTEREDLFPSQSAFNNLNLIEDSLASYLSNEYKAIFSGTFTHNKIFTLYFYLKDTTNVVENIKEIAFNTYNNNDLTARTEEDITWSVYKDILYPTEEILEYMTTMSIIDKMFEMGDQIVVERNVDHWLYFENEKDLLKCKEELESIGFFCINLVNNPETNFDFGLKASHNSSVETDTIIKFNMQLRQIAIKHNGEYDGWETHIVKEK
jgi:uncharacterized protein (TIGR01619 family)